MSKENYQNYGAPPTGGQYPNQMQQPMQPQQNQYGQMPPTGAPTDPNQQQQNYYQPPQSQSNVPSTPYPSGQPGSADRGQANPSYPGYQQQPYQGYYQQNTAPPPTQTPGFPDNSQARPEMPSNFSAQPAYPQAPAPNREPNTFSHHETSANVGGMAGGQPNFNAARQDQQQRQDPNFMGGQPSQFRTEPNAYPGYMQPPAAQAQPVQQQVAPESQVLGGFMGQAPNQQTAQTAPQQVAPAPEPQKSGMPEGTPGFQFPPNMDAGGAPTGAPVPPPMDIGGNADPSTMDIGALNRMAEYYATNSDYPKVSNPPLSNRQLSILKK